MSRSCGLAAVTALLLLVLLAATASAITRPTDGEETRVDAKRAAGIILGHDLHREEPAEAAGLMEAAANQDLHKEEPSAAARMAAAAGLMEEAAALSIQTAEKKDGAVPMEGKPSGGGGVAIQGDDPGQVPSSGGSGSASGGEHGKEESGGSGSSSKEGEKSAGSRSCLSKEECHKKRLLCGKGCTLSAHTKCAAKCSKSCVPTC